MSTFDPRSARVLIFDADGTLRWTRIEGRRYPHALEEQALMPGVKETLARFDLGPRGARIGVASNQPGVGLGLVARSEARRMIEAVLEWAIGSVPEHAAIEMCTCAPNVACARRKPEAGMLRAILARFGARPEDAVFVGDLPIDREAARRAGVHFMWARDFFAVQGADHLW